MKKNEPAFPQAKLDKCTNPNCMFYRAVIGEFHGLSIRDYFAVGALPYSKCGGDSMEEIMERTAKACYGYADAMIKERERHEEKG